jgi:thermitase
MQTILLAPQKTFFTTAILLILVLVGTDAVFAAQQNPNASNSPPQAYVPRRVLVKFRLGTEPKRVDNLISQMGATVQGQIPGLGIHVLRLATAGAEQAVAKAFANRPEVEFAEPDGLVEPDRVPNDPNFPNQWHLARIGGPTAWDSITGSSSVTIAILDTGVDATHPDLGAKMVPGWNMWDNNSNTSDVYGHGTAVAGTTAAAADNLDGVASVAWNCRIMPVRISDTNGTASYSTVANGLTWAADHGARVANLSYMMTNVSTVTTAAKYFQSKGGVVTMSAGNYSTFDSTSDNPYVLTVSATDGSDNLSYYSNTGNNIDLAAPGDSILTTNAGGGYGWWSGTSFSAPIVAGVAALVLSANPNLSGPQVQDILKKSADDLSSPSWDATYGWGRVNAASAVAMALSGSGGGLTDSTPPIVTIGFPSSGASISGTVTVQTSANDASGIASVSVIVDGTQIGTDTGSPYNFDLNTSTFPNGIHALTVTAVDTAGNIGSATLTVIVNNVADITPPAVSISTPSDGGTVSGNIFLVANATDNLGVVKLQLFVDGAKKAETSSANLSTRWSTNKVTKGSHTIQAVAFDGNGNSSVQTITVFK